MPSREVARLKRLKIDSLPETRLRDELRKTIETFDQEARVSDDKIKSAETRLNSITQSLTEMRKTSTELEKQNKELSERVKSLQSELAARGEPATGGGFKLQMDKKLLSRMEELEGEKITLAAELKSTRKLLEHLQSQQPQANEGVRTLSTDQIMKKFSEDVTAANRAIESDFEIEEVEVDVRGLLGEEQGHMVMGFDAKRQAEPEMSTRIKFNLKRRVETRILDDE